MAKGKKSSGKSETSKGERRSSMKTYDMWSSADRVGFKMDALSKGKDVYFTVPNPDKTQTNRQFIKMKISGREFIQRRKFQEKKPEKQNG